MGTDREADASATPGGILKCLHMLADEAAALGLPLTLAALHGAIELCALEGQAGPSEPDRRATLLH